jgi:hypothetical protein
MRCSPRAACSLATSDTATLPAFRVPNFVQYEPLPGRRGAVPQLRLCAWRQRVAHDVARLEGELAHSQANANRETAELKTDIERLTAELAGERADQYRLAAARPLADKATAELVELARRLAEIAEKQTSAETAEAEPEPPRRSKLGRAWGWFLRN